MPNTITGFAPLTILGTPIQRDGEARYCLNDCHRAAGAKPKDGPAQWLRTDQAKALVAEIQTVQNPTVSPAATSEGRAGGTFVVKELVYAYAMWISPAFHLAVIRAFDALVTSSYGKLAPEINLSEAMRRALGGIMKAVINKALEPIAVRFDELEDRVSGLAITSDPRVAAVEFTGMLEILRSEGVASKGRRQLSSRCSNALRRWIIGNGREGAIRISRETGKYVFGVDAAAAWLAAEGRAIIEKHKAAIAGQSSLNFSKPSRSKRK